MIPMANQYGITPLAWSPSAGGVLAGKYSRENLEKEDEDGGRKSMSQSIGQPNERSIEIGKIKKIAKEIDRAIAESGFS